MSNYLDALKDFNNARMKASLQEVLARISGKSNELLSYDDVAKKLKLTGRSERGLKDIPLEAIVGSVGRYTDFNRSFLPLKETDQERWAKVKTEMERPGGAGLPPIEVYKVGEVYFVLDGNHRVSIAHQEGIKTIQAYVIEVRTEVPLSPDIQPDDLIIKAEYVEFLEETGIKDMRPNIELSVSVPGQYAVLKEHIEVHRYFMGIDFQREISYQEAIGHWYDTVYLPIVEPIRDRDLLRWFPGRTETDLYLWVSEHRAMLERDLGWQIRPEAAATALASQESSGADSENSATGSWRQAKMYDRYTENLFKAILVSINYMSESWPALEQATLVAQKENAVLHGLHVISPKEEIDSPETRQTLKYFNRFLKDTGIQGNLANVKGEIVDQIYEYSKLTDLIVLNMLHAPSPGLAGLGSGLRQIIWRSARPILTVPGKLSPMDRALVAFDGSQKSKEALFVATYIAERWKTNLTILTVTENKDHQKVQEYARDYLELHEIEGTFMIEKGGPETFLKIMNDLETNLVLMGGYGGSAIKEVVVGSLVNFMLRNAKCPILISR
ncbi:MAG: universal stress protein [Anaerolineales bacterium]|nr:universal stress protein [Anaerolineales bacterium]